MSWNSMVVIPSITNSSSLLRLANQTASLTLNISDNPFLGVNQNYTIQIRLSNSDNLNLVWATDPSVNIYPIMWPPLEAVWNNNYFANSNFTVTHDIIIDLSDLNSINKWMHFRLTQGNNNIFMTPIDLHSIVPSELPSDPVPEPVFYQGWINTSTFGANNLNVNQDLQVTRNATISSVLNVDNRGHFKNELLVASSTDILTNIVQNNNLCQKFVVQEGITLANGSNNFASLKLTDSYLTVVYTFGAQSYEYNLLAIQPAGSSK